VPSGLPPRATIDRLRAQGAVISVSHPFDRLRAGHWALDDLIDIAPHVDALEGFNARCLFQGDNGRAWAFALQRELPITAGTDAHAAWEVGRAGLTLEPFTTADEFRRALAGAKVFGRLAPWWVHLFSRYASLCKRLGK
jgi:predicted metal-dependent phosphoesterase TrpH